ncbi:hypothetical protein E4H04_13065 [Candidatus Bathyarchaeota archaeon]|nr:MAG: hypothetical protein E4H04_13065 [Candidatus Bathyarchaeota archaeon]
MSTVEEILKPYEAVISTFDVDQQSQWAYWSGIAPQKVVEVRNGRSKTRQEINYWQNLSDICTMIAVVIPIIVSYLVNNMNIPTAASVIDALFPALVIYIQNKLKKLHEQYQTYILVDNPLYRLLSDIIIDIYESNYEKNETNHKTKWDELEKITQKIEI